MRELESCARAMNHHPAVAHIGRHRVEFQPDSAFIEWPTSRKPSPLPLCVRPIDNTRQSQGRHVTDKVLAVLFAAALAFVVLTWGSPL